jgi:transposase
MGKTRAPYPAEFREEAVRLAQSSGRPLKEIAGDLAVSEQTLRNWVFAAQCDGTAPEITPDEKEELRQLRRRVKVLEQEREILKKAAAWFAKETGSTP